MKRPKIAINRLSEHQMQKVRDYLTKMPNASHKGSKGEFYGGYIHVTADIRASIDIQTAKMSTAPWYEDVTFEVQDISENEYTAKRTLERSEVVKGLASLVVGFLAE